MNGALADSISALAFAIAPGLLLIRFFRPRAMPRWALFVLAATLGGASLYFTQVLQRADMMQQLGLVDLPQPAEMSGMVVLQGPGKTEFILGMVLQLVYLLLWLVPYGVTRIVMDRRRRDRDVAV